MNVAANFSCALMPVPMAVPPCASASRRGSLDRRRSMALSICARQPEASWPSVIGIASIRCVRPVLHDAGPLLLLLAQHAAQVLERRQQISPRAAHRAHVDRARNHVIAALAHVDVIVRMHGLPSVWLARCGDHLVDVHVGAGAAARLVHVERKLVPMFAGGDLSRRLVDRAGHVRGQQPEPRIGARGGGLDQREGGDEFRRHADAADAGNCAAARSVCAPHNASAGTSMSPKLSCSLRLGCSHLGISCAASLAPDSRHVFHGFRSTSRRSLPSMAVIARVPTRCARCCRKAA